MSFTQKIVPKQAFTVLDFGPESVLAIVARTQNGELRLLGAGESRAEGMACGGLECIGDAVESVTEAVRKAEQASGVKCRELYFNFDDPFLESAYFRGSLNLSGEGQISRADVEAAITDAGRFAVNFEKCAVYSRETGFLIDDRDAVADPIGIFGHKLEVTMHLLLARAEYCDAWQRIFFRATGRRAHPVLSYWSSAYGILPASDREKKRLIGDLGSDFLNVGIFERNRITDLVTVAAHKIPSELIAEHLGGLFRTMVARHEGVKEALVTGTLATDEALVSDLRAAVDCQVSAVFCSGIPKLDQPKTVSLAGLLMVADELRSAPAAGPGGRSMGVSLKQRAASFLEDFF